MQGSESGSWTAGGEDGGSERGRFDDHVSFIAPHSYEAAQCDKETGGSSRGRWWSSESRCRRELSSEENVGEPSDPKKVPTVRQELSNKAVDECVELSGDDNEDSDVASITPANSDNITVVTTASIPATTSVTASFHSTLKSDAPMEKLHGVSSINGCSKPAASTTLRNVFFPIETKRLPKIRKPQESVGQTADGEQSNSARQTPTLPVIPEPSIDLSHSSPPGEEPVRIEIPTESE